MLNVTVIGEESTLLISYKRVVSINLLYNIKRALTSLIYESANLYKL